MQKINIFSEKEDSNKLNEGTIERETKTGIKVTERKKTRVIIKGKKMTQRAKATTIIAQWRNQKLYMLQKTLCSKNWMFISSQKGETNTLPKFAHSQVLKSAACLIMFIQPYEMISHIISYYMLGQMILEMRKCPVKFQYLLQN